MGSVQRGAMVCRNDNGTLERVDGTGTYIGSATLESGKVVTKRFRSANRDEESVKDKWLKWQGRNVEDTEEEDMAETRNDNNKSACPFSGGECGARCPIYSTAHRACSLMLGGIGMYNVSTNLGLLSSSDAIELVAMAIGELKSNAQSQVPEPVEAAAKTAAEGVEAYLEGKSFLAFVNLHSKTVHAPYKKFCDDNGYPAESESTFSKVILKRYPELKSQPAQGGRTFVAA